MDQAKKLVESIINGLQEKKGKNIVIVNLTQIPGAICQYMVIVEGNTPTQVAALSDSVWETARKEMAEKPLSVDGKQNSLWIGMDYGTVIVHIFVPELRQFYKLENLWADSKLEYIQDVD